MGQLCGRESDQDPTPNARVSLPDFTSKAPHDKGKARQPQGIAHQSSIRIVTQDDDAPQYESIASVDALLQIIRQADCLKLCGIPGAFNILKERHFDIWIDSNYQLNSDTRNAIQLIALICLQLGKATDCNMTFYFTSYPNTKSKNLSDNSRNCLKSLRDLWGTDSWKGAVQLVAGASILETELGIQKWLNNEENFAKGETEDEKHVKLLGHVREKMLPYWHGWHQRDLNAESLIRYHGSAIFAAQKQPKSLNSIRFIYERSMGYYIRLMKQSTADPSKDVYPITNLFLLGSIMQPTEIASIKKFHESEGNEMAKEAKKLLRQQSQQQAEVVKGQGTQFQISSVLMTKHLSQTAVSGYIEIDNFATKENDINDLTSLDESEVLKCLLSPKAIFKILNSHNPLIDNLDFITKKELYSNIPLLGHNSIITVPTVKQLKDALHIEDLSALPRADDSDDEGYNGPIQTPAPVSVTIKAAPE
ncbi:hypothetical protein EDB81DRAFT_862703 [Dactylonectria macrodidyma]|uniref:Uncharacterized protein n=1 Tax=Dactylonectria macrodidyma TaxID=307937 RepID=A0A9P9D4I1_9HYPO|nr:hypothetical protein EDB81DRAFT_862703 [Dactylonectria macrodidyma]